MQVAKFYTSNQFQNCNLIGREIQQYLSLSQDDFFNDIFCMKNQTIRLQKYL